MDNLPDETLEKIFSYLTVKDKLNMFLVCQRFCEIVGSSRKLMGNIKILITLKSNYVCVGTIATTTRKYQHMQIKTNGVIMEKLSEWGCEDLLELMGNISKTLKTVVFNDLIVTSSKYIVKLLELTPNLETLESNSTIYKNSGEENQRFEIKLPKLKNLTIKFCYESYTHPFESLFRHSTNLNLLYLSYQTQSDQEMKEFLLKQKNLKYLGLHAKTFVNIFDNEFISAVPFRLKSLNLSFNNKFKNVLNFLKTQPQLQEITFSCIGDESEDEYQDAVNIMELVLKFPNIRKFDPFFYYESYGVDFTNKWCPQMEEIKLNLGCFRIDDSVLLNEVKDFIKIMPNLKSLHVCVSYHPRDEELTFLNTLNKLEHLQIGILHDASVMRYMDLKNLKSIKFVISHEAGGCDKMMVDDDWLPFFEKHKQLKNIQLYGTYFSKNLWLYIEENLTDLQKVAFEIFGNSDDESDENEKGDQTSKEKFQDTLTFLKTRPNFLAEESEYSIRSLVLHRK